MWILRHDFIRGLLREVVVSFQQKVYKRLKSGHSLTHQQAMHWWGCWRLAVVINRLRDKYGHDAILTEMVNRGGVVYARYHAITEKLK